MEPQDVGEVEENLELPVMMVNLAYPENSPTDNVDLTDHQVKTDHQDFLVDQDSVVTEEDPALREKMEIPVLQEYQETVEHPERQVHQEIWAIPDFGVETDIRADRDSEEITVVEELQELRDHQDHQEVLDQMVMQDETGAATLDSGETGVHRAQMEVQDLLEVQEEMETLDVMVFPADLATLEQEDYQDLTELLACPDLKERRE